MHERLGEALTALRERNHLGALGALAGIEQQILDLLAILKLLARTPSGVSLETKDSGNRRSRKRGDKRQ